MVILIYYVGVTAKVTFALHFFKSHSLSTQLGLKLGLKIGILRNYIADQINGEQF